MQSVWQTALASWSIPWGATIALVLTALTYLRGWYLLRCAGFPTLPPWRAGAFLSGLFALWVALASPMDVFNGWLLTAHMLQHMVLMMLAPPLILLGTPLIPLVRGLPVFAARELAGPFLNWKPAQRAGRMVTQPVVALVLMGLVMLGWHIPALYELALRSESWHQVEHISFFVTSLIFWWPVIQPWPSEAQWPRWAMVPYLVIADLQNTVLSATLVFADSVLYSSYLNVPRVFGLSAHDDQAAAGAIMWVVGSVAFLVPAILIAVQCLTRRHEIGGIQRLPKRTPWFAGRWRSTLSRLGLTGSRGEAASFIFLFLVAGVAMSAALALSGRDEDDLDLLAKQEAGDLVVSVYGRGHEVSTGENTFSVLVQGTSHFGIAGTNVELSAARQEAHGLDVEVQGWQSVSANRLLRSATINLPEPGTWMIRLNESDTAQSASFTFPVAVIARKRFF